MGKTLKIILGISAFAAAAGAVFLAKSGKFDEIVKKFKNHENESCSLEFGNTQDNLHKIAMDLKSDIEQNAKRISEEHHKRLQNHLKR